MFIFILWEQISLMLNTLNYDEVTDKWQSFPLSIAIPTVLKSLSNAYILKYKNICFVASLTEKHH